MQRACGERLMCEDEEAQGKQKRERLKQLMGNQKVDKGPN